MVNHLKGFRFYPTGEELTNFYLKNKNLGKTWLVDDAISEINICSYEPMLLPELSTIKSEDLVWYYFSPKVYANEKKTIMKRTTGSGFWKPTGKDRIIKDKRGSKIGFKKTLVYHEGKVANGVRTPWVMHEYHITSLPPNMRTYVLCQVKYKGDHEDILFGGNDSMVSLPNTVLEINTVPECQVKQPAQDGLYLNELSIPLNVQEYLPVDAINPNLLQQTPKVQVEKLAQDGLEMLVNEQEDLPFLDAFDPNTFFNDDLPNLLQQTPYGNEGNFEAVVPCFSGFIVDGSSAKLKPATTRVMKKLAGTLGGYFQGWGDEELVDEEKGKTMLGHFLSLQESQPDYFSDRIIKETMNALILAGMETETVTLECALSNHPEVVNKVRDEFDRLVGLNRVVDKSNISNLPYLQNIVSETLHNYSEEVPMLYDMPHGPSIAFPTHIAWDPKLWDDQASFKPERFVKEREDQKPMPFGVERRACPGSGLEQRLMNLSLGSLIQCLERERIGEEEDMTKGKGGGTSTMPKVKHLEASLS